MDLMSYFSFAEDDYDYFWESVENGSIRNSMAALAQSICEKYLKHGIDVYFEPSNESEQTEKNSVLRTHSLNRLLSFYAEHMPLDYSDEYKTKMLVIDGYYFSARYPGDNSIRVTESDIEKCIDAINACRERTMEICLELDSHSGDCL